MVTVPLRIKEYHPTSFLDVEVILNLLLAVSRVINVGKVVLFAVAVYITVDVEQLVVVKAE